MREKVIKTLVLIILQNIAINDCTNVTQMCSRYEFQCDNGECISQLFRCDIDFECKDQSDENNCDTCRDGFLCDSGHCIYKNATCNTIYDCVDESDERDCPDRLDVSLNVDHIKVPFLGTASWAINVTSKPQNFSILWKNWKEELIQFENGKYQIFRTNVDAFLTRVLVKIVKVSEVDIGNYSVTFTLDGENLKPIVINLSLTVDGVNIETTTHKTNLSKASKPEFINTNLENSSITVDKGKTVELICNVSGYPKPQISWTWEGQNVATWSSLFNYSLGQDNTVLSIPYVSVKNKGKFECTASNEVGISSAFVDINVKNYKLPNFLKRANLMNSSKFLRTGNTYEFKCYSEGDPEPNVTWNWQNEAFNCSPPSSDLDCTIYQTGQVLLLRNVSMATQGRLVCTASNPYGTKSAYVDVRVRERELPPIPAGGSDNSSNQQDQNKFSYNQMFMILGIVSSLLLIIFGVLFTRFYCKQRKLNSFFAGLSEKQFYEGDVENINPALGVADQAFMLPFQQTTWEIPKHRLKLGSSLGSGAFGLVLKAQAYGIVEGEEVTTVAVKMVKPNAEESHFRALLTELKIMAHLGKHLNVVNLIGAQTKNLTKKRELLVVMEYCKFGSLLMYMHRHRQSFINQLDPATDQIDISITTSANEASKMQKKRQRYLVHSFGNHIEASNGYSQDEYRGDYQPTDVKPIMTTDLLSWAFQVAKGMEYLSSRRVLHGDLAARNVLLAENNIVKICDFGYARETFNTYDYKRDTKGILLPVKWMAIESIYCGLFSSKSDCWSFGVFLWELFTLGNKPYPGMEINEDFCERLNSGFRMEKPQYAPNSVYHIMLDCWEHEPSDRPSFSQLSDQLGGLISSWLRNRIHDLNEGFTRSNQEANNAGRTDYLLQMGEPEYRLEGEEEAGPTTAIPPRYQEVPTPTSTSPEMEPVGTITGNIRNSQFRFFKQRPQPPPRRTLKA